MPRSSLKDVLLIAVRTVFMLTIGVWLGGLAFFGIVTAPFLFRIARAEHVPEIAPQMVTAMLGRFTYFTYACTVLLFLVWLIDGGLTGVKGALRRWWMVQGAGTVLAGVLALYLGTALFPRIVSGQAAVVPIFRKAEMKQPLSPREEAIRAEFDAGHKGYNRLASLSLWLLVGTLVAFSARTVAERNTLRE